MHLALPDFALPFIVTTDVAMMPGGLGAVLSQIQNVVERPIGFAGRALTQPESHYDVTGLQIK